MRTSWSGPGHCGRRLCAEASRPLWWPGRCDIAWAALPLLLAACATAPKRFGDGREPLAQPVTIALAPYMSTGLRTVQVTVAGRELTFLFDTGSGVTVISDEVATLVGCKPAGRLTGHRMSGERVEAPLCSDVALSLGSVPLKSDAMVTDIGALMPKDWARVHGVISLRTIEGLPFTFSLKRSALVFETPASFEARTATRSPAAARLSRPVGGAALDLFLKVDASPVPLWLLLDSGNIDKVVLAPHAARLLGLEVPPGAAKRTELGSVPLRVGGLDVSHPAVVLDVIYDGNLGTSFLEGVSFTADLASGRVWLEPAEASAGAGATAQPAGATVR